MTASNATARRFVPWMTIGMTLGIAICATGRPASAQSTSTVVNAATRDIQPTSFTREAYVRVAIDIDRLAPELVTVIEVVPPGWTAINAVPEAFADGSTVTWLNVVDDHLEYDAIPITPLGPSTWPIYFSGNVFDTTGTATKITGESALPPAERAVFQQGVFPDTGYTSCTDTYITMVAGAGHVPGDRNQGAHILLEEGDWYGIENPYGDVRDAPGFDDNRAILIRFGLEGIWPPELVNAEVLDARLRLYYLGQRRDSWTTLPAPRIDHPTYVHLVGREWGEGAGDGPDGPAATTGECSWLSARTGIDDWETSGCRGLSDITSPSLYRTQSASFGTTEGVWVEYDVTEFAKFWLANRDSNFGLKISQDDLDVGTSGYHFGAYTFASSEYQTDPLVRPMLSISFLDLTSANAGRWSLYR